MRARPKASEPAERVLRKVVLREVEGILPETCPVKAYKEMDEER